MERGGGRRVALGEELVRRRRSPLVVDALPALPRAFFRRRRQPEVGERCAEIQPRPADEHRSPAGRERVVDRGVRQPLVLADGSFMVEVPDPDQPRRLLGLRCQNRKAPVDLHRIGRDELGRKPARQLFGDATLAGGGRTENRHDEVGGHASIVVA